MAGKGVNPGGRSSSVRQTRMTLVTAGESQRAEPLAEGPAWHLWSHLCLKLLPGPVTQVLAKVLPTPAAVRAKLCSYSLAGGEPGAHPWMQRLLLGWVPLSRAPRGPHCGISFAEKKRKEKAFIVVSLQGDTRRDSNCFPDLGAG